MDIDDSVPNSLGELTSNRIRVVGIQRHLVVFSMIINQSDWDTTAAVPAPKHSMRRFSSTAFVSSTLVYFHRNLEFTWSLHKVKIESRVTPGKMVPSNGAVTSSFSPSSLTQNVNIFIVLLLLIHRLLQTTTKLARILLSCLHLRFDCGRSLTAFCKSHHLATPWHLHCLHKDTA